MTKIFTVLTHARVSGTASRRVLLAAAMLLGGALTGQAQTLYYWSGNGANASFTTANNFRNGPTSSTSSTPTSSDLTQLVFGARVAAGLVASNATAGFNVSALIFSNTSAQSFTITGSQIEFKKVGSVNPQIRQESSAAQTIATGIKLAEPLTLGGDGAGLVTMTGAWEAGSKGINKTGTSAFFIDVASVASSGTVTISNGTLALRTNTTISGAIVLNGGVLAARGTTNRALGTTFRFGANGGGFAAYNGAWTVNTSLGTWGSTANSLSNGASLLLGSRIANNVVTLSSNLNLGGAAGTNRVITLIDNTNSAADGAVVSGVISGSANLQVAGAGSLTLSADNTYTGSTAISNGVILKIGTNGTTGRLGTGAVTNNGQLIFHRSNDLTVSNAISGSGALTKEGAGTVSLIASNSYGGTTINAGALKIGTNGTAGTLGAGAVTNNGQLIFHRSNDLSVSNVISGTGSLSKLGAGTVILTASNSYAGGTLLNAGALAAGHAFAFGTGSITLTNSTVLNLSNFSIANLIINNGGTLTNVGTVSGAELNAGTTTLNASNSTVAEVSGTAAVTVAGNNTTITNVLGGTVSVAGTNTTLQSVSSGTVNVAGTNTTVQNLTGGTVNVTNGTTVNVQSGATAGSIAGGGGLVKHGANTLVLSGANTFSGGTLLLEGILAVANANALGSGSLTQSNGSSVLVINTTGTVTNQMTVSNLRSLQTVTLSGNKTLGNATYDITNNTTTTESGTLSGSGGITKLGTGTLVVTASNTFTGAVDVQAGLLNLNSATSSAAGGTTSVAVASGATLLISQNNQVNNTATVSLTGGTIRTAAGVGEVFGNLTVTGSGTLDFGATFGNASSMNFGTYTPSALLTINNFDFGSTLTFKSNLSGSITNSSFFTFNNGGIASSSWDGSTFTITAIPEPSTYLAAAGLLALCLWPLRRRLLPESKKA